MKKLLMIISQTLFIMNNKKQKRFFFYMRKKMNEQNLSFTIFILVNATATTYTIYIFHLPVVFL